MESHRPQGCGDGWSFCAWGHPGAYEHMISPLPPSLPLSCSNGMGGTRPSWSPAWSTTGASRPQSAWRTLPSGAWASTAAWSARMVAPVCPTMLSWSWKVSAAGCASPHAMHFMGVPWLHPRKAWQVLRDLFSSAAPPPPRQGNETRSPIPYSHTLQNEMLLKITQYCIVIQGWIWLTGAICESLWDIWQRRHLQIWLYFAFKDRANLCPCVLVAFRCSVQRVQLFLRVFFFIEMYYNDNILEGLLK